MASVTAGMTAAFDPQRKWVARKADVREAAPAVESYLMKVGRVRMVRPLYTAMMKGNDYWKALGRSTFERAKPKYHPITRGAIADLFK